MYSLFSFEALRRFTFRVLKMLEQPHIIYTSFVFATAGRRTSILRACNMFLMAVCRDTGDATILIEVCRRGILAAPNLFVLIMKLEAFWKERIRIN